jgi:hypothetical protein
MKNQLWHANSGTAGNNWSILTADFKVLIAKDLWADDAKSIVEQHNAAVRASN